jgi:hypothetical protein
MGGALRQAGAHEDQQSKNANTPTAKAVQAIEMARSRLSRFMARPWFQGGISDLDANQTATFWQTPTHTAPALMGAGGPRPWRSCASR